MERSGVVLVNAGNATSPGSPLRAVVVGYGYSGRAFHSYLISLTEGLHLHGIVARDPKKAAAAAAAYPEARIYRDFNGMLDDAAVDVVVLATPSRSHCPLAVEALNAGKHVVTDKIMCLSLDECDRMIEASQHNRKVLSVFQNRRWDGDFLTLRKLCENRQLGDLRWLECAWQGPRPMRNWRASLAEGGGRFLDLGAHLIDQVLLLFPSPVTRVYFRTHHDRSETDTESHALLVLSFEDGCTAVVDTGSTHFASKPRFYALGDQGTFVKYGLDPQEEAMKAGRIDDAREPEDRFGEVHGLENVKKIPTVPGRWRSYYERFVVEVHGGDPAVPLEESRRVIAVVEAAFQSARDNRTVETYITTS